MTEINWDPVPGDAPWIRIRTYQPSDREEKWIEASVRIGATVVGVGEVPLSGIYQKENIAERSAISLALGDFNRRFASHGNREGQAMRTVGQGIAGEEAAAMVALGLRVDEHAFKEHFSMLLDAQVIYQNRYDIYKDRPIRSMGLERLSHASQNVR